MLEKDQPKLPDNLKCKDFEDEIFINLNKKSLMTLVELNNIDFNKVIVKKKSYNEDFHKFNYLVKKLVRETKITMIECAVFLYTDYFKEKMVFECFDEDNMYTLRTELARKYNIGMDTNVLKYFLQRR